MLVAHVEQSGVWLVDGGMHRLATVLADLARARGVVFRFGAEVAAIGVAGGRARSVALVGGDRIEADAVVCNADCAALAGGLFGAAVREAAIAPKPAGRSFSAVTIAMRATATGFPLARHNVFFSPDSPGEFAELAAGRLPAEPTSTFARRTAAPQPPARHLRPERLFCIVKRPGQWGHAHLRSIGDRAMRSEDFSSAGTLRPQSRLLSGPVPRDDAQRVSPALSGDWGRSLWGGVARLDGVVPPLGRAQPRPGTVPLRRQRSSRTGAADGGALGPDGSPGPGGGLRFDAPVPPGGYAWWYIDGLSTDGEQGITLIAFVGSVFSPYYAWARAPRARRSDQPLCPQRGPLRSRAGAVGHDGTRPARASPAKPARFSIGPSALAWDGTTLTLRIDERTAPVPSRIRGTVRVRPEALTARSFALDGAGAASLAARRTLFHDRGRPAGAGRPLERPGLFRHQTPATRRSRPPSGIGTGRGRGCRAAPPSSTTSSAARARPCRWPCMSTGPAPSTNLPCPPAARLPRTLWRLPRTDARRSGQPAEGDADPGGRAVLCPLARRLGTRRPSGHDHPREPLARPLPRPVGAGDAAVSHAAIHAVSTLKAGCASSVPGQRRSACGRGAVSTAHKPPNPWREQHEQQFDETECVLHEGVL